MRGGGTEPTAKSVDALVGFALLKPTLIKKEIYGEEVQNLRVSPYRYLRSIARLTRNSPVKKRMILVKK